MTRRRHGCKASEDFGLLHLFADRGDFAKNIVTLDGGVYIFYCQGHGYVAKY